MKTTTYLILRNTSSGAEHNEKVEKYIAEVDDILTPKLRGYLRTNYILSISEFSQKFFDFEKSKFCYDEYNEYIKEFAIIIDTLLQLKSGE